MSAFTPTHKCAYFYYVFGRVVLESWAVNHQETRQTKLDQVKHYYSIFYCDARRTMTHRLLPAAHNRSQDQLVKK